VHWVSQQK